MQRYNGIVIHFGEIWLKGKNRNLFVRELYNNIKSSLDGENYSELRNMRDRFFLVLDNNSNIESISKKLSKVFGISRFSPVITCNNDINDIFKASSTLFGKKDRVRIVPHRSLKSLDFDSRDIITYFIKNSEKLNFSIDKDADKELYINAAKGGTFLYTERIPGLNGLPVGSSGSAVVLFSGGIDSPVASYYTMKRGLKPIYMHVHAFPGNDDERISKIKGIAEALSMYHKGCKLYLIPGHIFQSAALKSLRKYELVLFKLFLYRLAEKIAKKEEADCLVSGESLGQVASQTVDNLAASQHGIKRLIIRPLIGFDKQEIINIARQIGTYDLSIMKYRDVCSIVAKNPATRSSPEKLRILWKTLNMDTALKMTIGKSSVIEKL